MNKKILFPVTLGICAAFFAACGSDSGSNASDDLSSAAEIVPTSSAADPAIESSASVDPQIASSAVDPLVTSSATDPLVVSSSAATPVQTSGAPAEATIGTDGYAQTWVRSEDGLTAMANNESVGTVDADTYTYLGAELSGVDQFTYGRFEARMKMVSIPGSVSSMFLYYDNSYLYGDEPWNEIDIEVLGNNVSRWQSNLITRHPDSETGKTSKTNTTSEHKHLFGFDATQDFHLYAMIWTPEYISWEIDSVEIRRDYLGEKKAQVEFMTQQQSLRFNLWASKSSAWVGKFTGEELANGPKQQFIDYVRVYSYDTTTKTFTFNWQDDFDGDDISDHWNRGSWDMEYVTLSRDNVEVKDGYCVLSLSRE